MRDRILALNSWHDDWSGLRVAVLGLGLTGFSVADTLVELGATVRVIYAEPDADRERLLDVIGSERYCDENEAAQLTDMSVFEPDLVVVSPGFAPDSKLTTWAEEQGIVVWGDIDLGWRLRDKTQHIADWIVLTGTNGKSTTAQLTAHMLVAGGLRAVPAGNIGTPLLDVLRDPVGYDAIVLDLSSFQLHRMGEISPYASACLNVFDTHLDWHGSAAAYRAATAKVYENTQVACVYNRADLATEHMLEYADVVEGARAISFGLDTPPPSGFGIVEEILVDRGYHAERHGEAFELVTLQELIERGIGAPHMVQNVLAASALARARGVEPSDIARAILSFTPDVHRTQLLGTHVGVHFIDDSKATNLAASAAALRTVTDVVWVLGGEHVHAEIGALVKMHTERLRAAVVIGADRAAVLAALAEHLPADAIAQVDDAAIEASSGDVMAAAVQAAVSLAQPGATVLLSPAADADQFESYAERGRLFQAAVARISGGGAGDAAEATGI